MAGYSGKPLTEKLGYKPGDRVVTFDAPESFGLLLIENGVVLSATSPADWLHGFFKSNEKLKTFLKQVNLGTIDKGFWVSWPKKASKQKTDLSEQTFRDLILPLGWVDTKVCAIDETWSGLKFLRRKS